MYNIQSAYLYYMYIEFLIFYMMKPLLSLFLIQ